MLFIYPLGQHHLSPREAEATFGQSYGKGGRRGDSTSERRRSKRPQFKQDHVETDEDIPDDVIEDMDADRQSASGRQSISEDIVVEGSRAAFSSSDSHHLHPSSARGKKGG
jgi:hypothetical protein